MNQLACATLMAGAISVLSAVSANAMACNSEITRFEVVVRQSGGYGALGPTLPQSISAQLGRQPTVRSVMRAKGRAKAEFKANMVRAKKFAAQGRDAECMKALSNAELMFDTR